MDLAKVKCTNLLKQFFPDLEDQCYEGATVLDVFRSLNDRHPGVWDFIIDEHQHVRPHINVFVDKSAIDRKEGLSLTVAEGAEILIIQAVSGG